MFELEEQADPEEDQVFLENYIREFVEDLLYKIDCRLIDKSFD